MHLFPGVTLESKDCATIELRYGSMPSLRFVDLNPSEHAWLMSLVSPAWETDTSKIQLATESDLAGQRGIAIISKALIDARYATQESVDRANKAIPTELAFESLAQRANAIDSHAVLSARTRAIVAVKGINLITLEMIRVLALSGIRNFLVDDSRPANSVEFCAVAGFGTEANTRAAATEHYLLQVAPNAKVLKLAHEPHVAITTCTTTRDELDAAALTTHGIATLQVWHSQGTPVVGPFNIPEMTPCIACQNSASGLSSAMTMAHNSRPLHTAGDPGLPIFVPHAASIATLCGTLAASQILTFIDGEVPSSTHTVFHANQQQPGFTSVPLEYDGSCLCMTPTH